MNYNLPSGSLCSWEMLKHLEPPLVCIDDHLTVRYLLDLKQKVIRMDRDLGTDAYQELWSKFLKAGCPAWEPKQILLIARNLLRDLQRQEKRHHHTCLPVDGLLVESSHVDVIQNEEIRQILDLKLQSLPSNQRDVLIATTLQGRTIREESECSGIPVETLRTRKKRAIHRLGPLLAGLSR